MTKAKIPVSINGLEFDALISEDQTLGSTVPEYTVEEGSTMTDSIILNPEELSMVLFVTDTPVTWANRHGTTVGRTKDVVRQLKELFLSRMPVTVVTTDETYTNMAIENITLSKSSDVGTSREIPISFKKINTTKSETTTIPASYGKSGATKSAAGTASTASAAKSASTSGGSSSKSSGGSSGSNKKSSILYGAAKGIGLI